MNAQVTHSATQAKRLLASWNASLAPYGRATRIEWPRTVLGPNVLHAELSADGEWCRFTWSHDATIDHWDCAVSYPAIEATQ